MTMLRRLVAILALITGLAALTAPAHAWGDAGESRAVAEAHDFADEADTTCVCHHNHECTTTKRSISRKATPHKKTVVVKVPSVFFGADRAFE